jgi:hypothetical protein
MNEQELRSIVRAAVARHLGADAPMDPMAGVRPAAPPASHAPAHVSLLGSHSLYAGLVNVTDTCVIEPAVSCDHCGYCRSHGY